MCLDSCGHTSGLLSFIGAMITCADMCTTVYICAGICVNSGPPAHFTHRQTSKAV